MNLLKSSLKKIDRFGYRYEFGFKGKETYKTVLGGSFTIIIGALICWQAFESLSDMLSYDSD